jgi:hypothetical protein
VPPFASIFSPVSFGHSPSMPAAHCAICLNHFPIDADKPEFLIFPCGKHYKDVMFNIWRTHQRGPNLGHFLNFIFQVMDSVYDVQINCFLKDGRHVQLVGKTSAKLMAIPYTWNLSTRILSMLGLSLKDWIRWAPIHH